MVVQHNIMALNSHRRLGVNNTAVGKNLEKLSSGYRINRAGDDAAGLAISEKMRAQIKGLEVAQRNAQDGISLVQTAEGALDEVHSMLKRMVELSTQAANGTYDDKSRGELQKEITKLNEEIDRIAEGTNFNDIKLLNGDLGKGNLPNIKGLEALTPDVKEALGKVGKIQFGAGGANITGPISTTISYTDENGKTQNVELKLEYKNDGGHKLITSKGTVISLKAQQATKEELASAFAKAAQEDAGLSSTFSISVGGTGKDELFLTNKKTGTGSKAELIKAEKAGTGMGDVTPTPNEQAAKDKEVIYDFDAFAKEKVFEVNGEKFVFTSDPSKFGSDVTSLVVNAGGKIVANDAAAMAKLIAGKTGLGDKVASAGTTISFGATPDNGGLSLQVGDTGEEFNQLIVNVNSMDAKSLGVSDVDISSISGARAAIDKIKSAIDSVSSTRSDLGAVQNRLEHTISNLSVAAENMTASESRIRDVDMAKEMMMFTQNNVLSQAAQAMLAQSNQQPQQILQLLR